MVLWKQRGDYMIRIAIIDDAVEIGTQLETILKLQPIKALQLISISITAGKNYVSIYKTVNSTI